MKALVTLAAILVLIPGVYAQRSAELGTRIAAAARQQIGVTTDYDAGYVT